MERPSNYSQEALKLSILFSRMHYNVNLIQILQRLA